MVSKQVVSIYFITPLKPFAKGWGSAAEEQEAFPMAHRFARGSKERHGISWQMSISEDQETIKKECASRNYKSEAIVRLERRFGQ